MYLGTSADKHPDKPALIFADRELAVTYRELEERSNRLAHAFRAGGLGPGDGIAAGLTNGDDFFDLYCFLVGVDLFVTGYCRE